MCETNDELFSDLNAAPDGIKIESIVSGIRETYCCLNSFHFDESYPRIIQTLCDLKTQFIDSFDNDPRLLAHIIHSQNCDPPSFDQITAKGNILTVLNFSR